MKLDLAKIVDDYNIILKFMPLGKVKGSTRKSEGHYVVLINENLGREATERVLTHELLHIVLGHLDEAEELSESVKEWQVASMMLSMGMISGRKKV